MERRFERSDDVLKEFKNDVEKRFEKSDQNLNDFKLLIDKRFEQVDKRFEKADQHLNDFKTLVDKRLDQIVASIELLTEKLDHRDEKQRGFTIRMFTVAITVSFLGVLGTMLKLIEII